MGVDLIFQGFQFGLGLGNIQLFYPGLGKLPFLVEEQDLIQVGDEAGRDNDDQGAVDQRSTDIVGFQGQGFPDIEQHPGEDAGVDDVGQEERQDDLIVFLERPAVLSPDQHHQPYVPLPDQERNEDEVDIRGEELRVTVKPVGNKT